MPLNPFQTRLTFFLSLVGLLFLLPSTSLIFAAPVLQLIAILGLVVLGVSFLAWRRTQLLDLLSSVLGQAVVLPILGILIALVFSPDPRLSLDGAGWLVGVWVIFLVMVVLFRSQVDRSAVLHAWLWLTGVILLAAALEVYGWYSVWFQKVGGAWLLPPFPYRLTSLLGQSNPLIGLVNLLAPFCLLQLLKASGRVQRFLCVFWLALYLFALPFTSSRGGWLGAGAWIAVGAGLWLLDSKRCLAQVFGFLKRKPWLALCGGGVGVAVFFGAAVWFWVAFASNPSHGTAFSLNREDIWGAALRVWLNFPFSGAGPGRFGLDYIRETGYPPGFWASHAHNLPLMVLGELGLVGFVPYAIFWLITGRNIYRAYRRSSGSERVWKQAALSALAAFGVQALFEDFNGAPLILACVAFAAAWALVADAKMEQPLLNRRPGWAAAGLTVLVLALILTTSIFNLWASAPLEQAVRLAEQGHWAEAARLAEESLSRDRAFAYYAYQAGMAEAALWDQTGDKRALNDARMRLEQSLQEERNYSVILVELALLERQDGDFERAFYHLEEAISRSPRNAEYRINLGLWREQTGNLKLAREAYQKALEILAPRWFPNTFWNETALRRELVASMTDRLLQPESYWQQARRQIQQGDLKSAQLNLARSWAAGEDAASRQITEALAFETANRPQEAFDAYRAAAGSLRALYEEYPGPVLTYNLYFDRPGFRLALTRGWVRLFVDEAHLPALERLVEFERRQGDCLQLQNAQDLLERVRDRGERRGPAGLRPACE